MSNPDGTNYQIGENHHKAKLTEDDVRNIRAIHDDYRKALEAIKHMTPSAQARKHDVSKNAIESVIYRKSWKGVK
jgi:hypothetical protein